MMKLLTHPSDAEFGAQLLGIRTNVLEYLTTIAFSFYGNTYGRVCH